VCVILLIKSVIDFNKVRQQSMKLIYVYERKRKQLCVSQTERRMLIQFCKLRNKVSVFNNKWTKLNKKRENNKFTINLKKKKGS